MKKAIVSLTFLVFVFGAGFSVFSQSTSKKKQDVASMKLSREQMKEDFDYMIKVIENVYPKDYAQKKIMGTDMKKILISYRDMLNGKETPGQFAKLLSDALLACKGDHLWLACPRLGPYLKRRCIENISLEDIKVNKLYHIELNKLRHQKTGINFFIDMYCKGAEYYTALPFKYENQEYPEDLKLLKINNKEITSILKENIDKCNEFDWEKKIYYTTHNILNLMASNDVEKLDLLFVDPAGKKVNMVLKKGTKVKYVKNKKESKIIRRFFSKKVCFIPECGILYIRLPSMNPQNNKFYKDSIIKKVKGKISVQLLWIYGTMEAAATTPGVILSGCL